MKSIVRLSCMLSLIAITASAQMMGGGRGPGGGTYPSSPQRGAGWMDFAGPGMVGMRALVAGPDGTAYLVQTTDPDGDGTGEASLIAVASTATILWNVPVELGTSVAAVSEAEIYLVRHEVPGAMPPPETPLSTVEARSLTSGSLLWSAQVEGRVVEMEPFPGGVWVLAVEAPAWDIVTRPPARASHMGERTLSSIATGGQLLGTISLDR